MLSPEDFYKQSRLYNLEDTPIQICLDLSYLFFFSGICYLAYYVSHIITYIDTTAPNVTIPHTRLWRTISAPAIVSPFRLLLICRQNSLALSSAFSSAPSDGSGP